MKEMRYRLVNLGQGGQNMVLSRDFDAFYRTALEAASGIAAVAEAQFISDEERAEIGRQIGKIRDYTVPMAQAQPQVCPPAPACPACGVSPGSNSSLLLGATGLILGLALGAFVL